MTTLVATGAPAPIRRGSANRRKQLLAPYLFVLPFFVVFVAMLVVPLGYAAWTSLFRSRLIGGKVFAGLDNYTRALTDPGFLEGLRRVALILLVQVPIMLGLALVFALVLDSGRCAGRAPYACSSSCRMPCQVSSRPSCGATSTVATSARSARHSGRSVSRRPTSSRNRTCSARS